MLSCGHVLWTWTSHRGQNLFVSRKATIQVLQTVQGDRTQTDTENTAQNHKQCWCEVHWKLYHETAITGLLLFYYYHHHHHQTIHHDICLTEHCKIPLNRQRAGTMHSFTVLRCHFHRKKARTMYKEVHSLSLEPPYRAHYACWYLCVPSFQCRLALSCQKAEQFWILKEGYNYGSPNYFQCFLN